MEARILVCSCLRHLLYVCRNALIGSCFAWIVWLVLRVDTPALFEMKSIPFPTFCEPSATADIILYSFDIDLPVDCDDEYWNHPDPARRFKQPPGKPSSATAFIFYIKVLGILGQSLRTIVRC